MALVLIAGITGYFVLRSDWLREKVRERIIQEAQLATGGRIEIAAFRFDWKSLTAEFDKLVIHGREAPGQAPLLAVDRVSIGLRIISLMEQRFDVTSVTAERPSAHLIVDANGGTNIPEPARRRTKGVAETILDLKVGTFEVRDGSLAAESPAGRQTRSGWNSKGEKLTAKVKYAAAAPRYEGEVSLGQVHLALDGLAPFDASVRFTAAMEKDRITVSSALLKMEGSEAELTSGLIAGFTNPVATARYRVRASLREVDRVFKLVNFQHIGTVELNGEGRFASVRDYDATGTLRGAGIQYGPLKELGVTGRYNARPERIALSGVKVTAPGGNIEASGEVRNFNRFQATGTLDHFDANDLAALAGLHVWADASRPLPYDGLLSGVFDVTGTLSEPQLHQIKLNTTMSIAPVAGQKRLTGQASAHYDSTTNTLDLGPSWVELPASRVDISGTLGKTLDIKIRSRDLADLLPALGGRPFPFELRNGSVAFDGKVIGPMENPRVAGHGEFTNAVLQGRGIDSLSGDVELSETNIKGANLALAWGQVRARGSGSVDLTGWVPSGNSAINANLQIATPDIPGLLALGAVNSNAATGTLSATVLLSGRLGSPAGGAQFTLTKGQLAGEPYDSIAGRVEVTAARGASLEANVAAGTKRLKVSSQFTHAGTNLTDGKVTYAVTSNALPLGQIALVRKWQPTIGGTAEFTASGAIEFTHTAAGVLRYSLPDLNADIATTGLALDGRNFGNARLSGSTKNNVLTAKLDTTAAQSTIHGEGTMTLTGQYPLQATVTFASPDLKSVAAFFATDKARDLNLEGAAEGQLRLRGEARSPERITGTAELSKLEMRPGARVAQSGALASMVLRNDGPVQLSLGKAELKVERARFLGPQTSLGVSGTIGLAKQAGLDLNIQGNVNMALAQTLTPDLTSSGDLAVDAVVRGTFGNPDFSGRADLRKAEFHYADFTNALTNANGVIRFSGTRANVQTFSADTGGGRVEATGFLTWVDGLLAFRLEATAREVRVRYPEGVSSVSDGDLTFAGNTERSEASGRITIRRISINPKSDLSTILAASAQPIRTPEARGGLLSNMNLDVQVETAPDVAFQTNVAERIQADASLRLRGTATSPAVLGRINITQGELVFFGNKYTINQGAISFFNPAKIDPILNLDLETRARGVDVFLTATGPIAKLNVSYRSDPPLQFADIVALLATGRSPTDPTLAVRDTGQSLNLQQIGASALLGQAIANPVAGRLQRFFGVSRIKIDPQLTGVTASPGARLTIEQQVTPDLLFTYVSDVANTSTQLIRAEWAFNPKWSAVLTRAENGYVDLAFAFKKSFR